MKWRSLLQDLKDKVGVAETTAELNVEDVVSDSPTPPSSSASPSSINAVSAQHDFNSLSPTSRDKRKLELDFTRYWEEFRSSSSEQEKEAALNLSVNTFCRLVKQHANVDQLVTILVETHIFSFVIGRAFVTDVEKLKISSKTRSLDVEKVLNFFSEVTKEGSSRGADLLTAVEVLASGPFDKQSLLDSGILCCLIHILNVLLTYSEGEKTVNAEEKVVGNVVHIMKALASHPSAAQSLIEDDSFELLFKMVYNGSLVALSQYKDGLVSLHNIQLHRHAMQEGSSRGADLLTAVEVLASGPFDKQSLLDSGILCCLIHILNVLLTYSEGEKTVNAEEKVVGNVVHIMKALASHPSAAQSLIEDDSFELLFKMVYNGSLVALSQYKDGLVSLHNIQLHRHAMQILGLLLVNDNGSTASYIRKHHLIKVLLVAVKDFDPDCGDSSYTMGIVDLLLDCVELSYRPETGGVRLKEDIRNAHGYHFLVQFALILSSMPKDMVFAFNHSSPHKNSGSDDSENQPPLSLNSSQNDDRASQNFSPSLSRLLDVLVTLAQTGPIESPGANTSLFSHTKPTANNLYDEDHGNGKVKDLEAVQMLQDIFLKAENKDLQAEVLNRMFKIFTSHMENYRMCQELRTVPLLLLNMDGFPSSLQELILKILEYAVTVVNCVPEQELLSLCFLLQQPINSELKHTILSFFVKLTSFDLRYKKVLGEVGVLEVLQDDLKQCKLLLKKSEANQAAFRFANGVTVILPFLISDEHRTGVLRILSCLITEDIEQIHHEELEAVIDVLKSGMVTGISGHQYKLHYEARCDTMGALWRILGVNGSAQRLFGEATGFSLMLTTLHTFQGEEECRDESLVMVFIKLFRYLLRLMTTAACENSINRMKLHSVITSQIFYDLVVESGLLCADLETQVIQLFLELALEVVLPPFLTSESMASAETAESEKASFLVKTPSGQLNPDKQRIYNAGAVRVLIRSLLLFTPKMQLEFLNLLERFARASPFNLENLTSAGCVELLLEIIQPFLPGSSPFLSHALKIVEVLGAYRLSPSELKLLCKYVIQMRAMHSGHSLVGMMEKLILMEDTSLEDVSLAPFVEMDMSKTGHASVQVSLGERSWPPAAGYSFVLSLSLLACVLHQNSQNVKDMETYRGYHLLALFLRPKMALFDMKCLEILFQISACEAFFSEPKKLESGQSTICMSPTEVTPENNYEDLSLSKFQSKPSSVGSHGYLDDFSGPKDSFSHLSELEMGVSPVETSNCIVLSNADMVEHVLLDWTLWVTAPVSIQIALLDFLENLVSMRWYRSHNLTILRQINLVEHLLVTLQRGNVEVLVLEKLVIFLGCVLQESFLTSELESVVRFVIMTFNPPEIKSQNSSMRESMGKHVIVRNLLLEMLIDLQVTIKAEELLEQWHKIVSSKLLTYFFDRLSMQSMLAHHPGNLSQVTDSLVDELVEGNADMTGDLQGEALMHKTYAARLMGGEASAPATATSIIRFMVDLAKMCPQFSAACRSAEFLQNCADLYFSCIRASHAVKIAKQLSVKGEEQNISCWDDSSAKSTFSRFPHRDQSTKTSISAGSFPQEQASVSSVVMPLPSDYVAIDKMENILTTPPRDSIKSFQGREKQDGDHAGPVSASSEMQSLHCKGSSSEVQPTESHTSESFSMLESPLFSEKSSLDVPFTPSPSPAVSSLSSNYNEFKSSTSSSPLPSHISVSEFAASSDHTSGSSAAHTIFTISPKILLETDESGYGGGSCSAGASAVLDFMAEVCADLMSEQIKAVQALESILEMIPLYVNPECVLVFQGLCLSRVMNYLERRLLRDDEEDNKTLDKRKWSTNLDAFCWMIVDRLYMGAFPQPIGVLKTLEFLLSILQLANKDGRVEEATSSGKGLLSIGRATRQLDAYVHSVLKNTNRAILYCFLPSFLTIIGEEDLLSRLGLFVESNKSQSSNLSVEESEVDISTVLQLLVANKNIIFCPSNLDRDLNCSLCVNLISLLHDQRKNVQNMASNIVRYLLVHRKSAFQDLLVKKPHRGKKVDVLHGGFDRLLTENLPEFSKWLESSEQIINKVLEQGAAVMWKQYIAGSEKFPDVRMKGMDGRRTREMGRKSRDTSKLDEKHWEQVSERRYALEIVRDAMSAELRVVRQNKYGSILYAESVWQTHLQQLVHERGIFPLRLSQGFEDKWQLCPIEGPYRMRKKLERCKLKIDSIHNLLEGKLELGEIELLKSKNEDGLVISDMDSEQAFLLSELYSESFFEEADDLKDFSSARNGWNNDRASSTNEASLQNALSFGGKSCSTASVPISVYTDAKSENGSPINSSSGMDEIRAVEEESEKELNDDGDYLIRPYLEHLEKVRFQYNCERVVGLDKHDGIFLIGELCLYVIENFYIDDHGCICEKESEDELSIIDQALGVTKQFTGSLESQSKSSTLWSTTMKTDAVGGRAWAYGGGAWGKEKVRVTGNLQHPRRMWKLDSVHEILKRDYELRPVAVEIFSMDGCNDLLVFHKKEREEVFRNLLAMNLPRNSMLDTTISGSAKQESKEGSRLFKLMAKSFTKRWQNGEISNFQYLMHLNTLAGRGYSDLTQYPVFPWILADYDSESLDLSDPKTFRKLDKPMGCQTPEGEEEFRKRYESWDDPEVPNFHYGSHYSSAGIVLFYLIRLPPFSAENQKLQGGQFDHADRLFNSIKETWLSAAGKGNTSDVKELIPEFFYMPEFLENRFYLDLGEKQSGEKVSNVSLPPWARGSVREFICKHREALESDYVSENLHHWIDLIFGHKQRGKAAEKAVNVFYHYTYEGNVDVDAVTDPTLKASILAQINHFGQTPKQLFQKPHVKRRTDRKFPLHPLKHSMHLVPREIRKLSSSINQIITFNEKLLVAGSNCFLKPRGYKKYIRWGFPDMSLRFMSYDQDKLLSTHENLHEGNQIQCAGVSHDGRSVVTGADDGLVSVWRVNKDGLRGSRRLRLEKSLCAHTAKVTCLRVSQPYMMIASGSDDCTVIIWDLSSLSFVRQLPNFPVPISAIYINDLTGEIITAAGNLLAVWSINGDCLAVVKTSQLPSDLIVSVTGSTFSDWLETTWYVTGHQSGALRVWQMVHCTDPVSAENKPASDRTVGIHLGDQVPEYKLLLHKELKFHKKPVTALHLTIDLKQLLSGDSDGHLLSWTVPDEILKASLKKAS
ncbi:PREDICTED: BEACH domain-containing protein A2-like [Camelina sativa]|uniref:BEACH domain-containing protein A2-like n=1 Tax=Camelina sativa TaxID=90675 RepID=A0ABM1QED4_CAMSA|nr:PREDICTED: BEACH domain-containing protein A2-like [Camelina sativa]